MDNSQETEGSEFPLWVRISWCAVIAIGCAVWGLAGFGVYKLLW